MFINFDGLTQFETYAYIGACIITDIVLVWGVYRAFKNRHKSFIAKDIVLLTGVWLLARIILTNLSYSSTLIEMINWRVLPILGLYYWYLFKRKKERSQRG